ncbi:TolC family protein [Spirochaetes bacterium]|uniref:TolC family protein n=1 Tax=Candidatus Scatousia excrementipullorum TaxID=2840936 RepID=A0A9D9DMR9_9BACT|nr:TolC family protein [Candidatus Scatousia excrementipullorum]
MKGINILKIYLVVGAVLFSTSIACAAEKYAVIEKGAHLTISDCIKIALNNSPLIKQAHYNYRISKADLGLAKSAFFPTIGVGAGYNYNANKNNRYSTNQDYYSAEASLNQLIWNFGKTNARIKMQKFNKIAALYTFDNVVLDTIYGVKNYYYAVLAAKATVDINRANVQINERNYQRTKAYFDEGIRSKIDLVNAEVYLSDSKVTLVQSERAYQNAIIALNNAMYVAYTPEYEIENTETFNFNKNEIPVNLQKISEKTDLSKTPNPVSDATLTSGVEKLDVIENYKFKPFPYTFEQCVEEANKNRPDLKAYEATIEAMKQSLLYIKREYYPELTGSVGYGYRDLSNTNSLNVGVNISSSVNILGKKYEIDSGKLQVDLAKNTLEMAKQNMYFDIQDAYVSMKQYEKQIPLLAVKVRQTLENLELADGRYSVGLGDYIELQDAKVNYNNAQNSYVQAVYNYNVSRSNLERLIALPQEITVTVEDQKS